VVDELLVADRLLLADAAGDRDGEGGNDAVVLTVDDARRLTEVDTLALREADADAGVLAVGDALGHGDTESSKHSTCMTSRLKEPLHGSVNRPLVAGTEQTLRPRHAERTTGKEFGELHVL
jgi:hypothetical protein